MVLVRNSLPEFIEIKDRIKNGDLGNLVCGEHYSKGLFNNASHFVNLMGEIFGHEALSINSVSKANPSIVPDDIDIDFDLFINTRKLNIKCIDNNSYEIFEGKLYFDGGIVSIDDGGAKLNLNR